MKHYYVIVYIFMHIYIVNCFFDPITIGIGGAIVAGIYNFKFLKENTYCKLEECCNSQYVPVDTEKLRINMKYGLYGQHIVENVVMSAINSHYHQSSRKPLVMSFHGTPGTGKNYVADMIADAIFQKGVRSKFYHKYVGRMDFPMASMIESYKYNVKTEIMNAIKDCPRSIFVFDEVDKMPIGIFDSITSLLDQHDMVHGVDLRLAVFIFLSNRGGAEISQQLKMLLNKGTWREDSKLHDFEIHAELGAYNENGGFYKSAVIESSVIDHFIPFLPLEKRHVEKCVAKELSRVNISPTTEKISQLMKYITFDEDYLFANSGCKRITKKVEILY